MNKAAKNVFAMQNPDGQGHQVSYEEGVSRKLHIYKKTVSTIEEPPHGAGSFHNPEQHQNWMDRISDYIKGTQS